MAYIIKEEVINEIRKQADIVDIISGYLNVSVKGKNYVALCPFHDDHSPSLVISREKQIFNCFTCRTGGNVFNFVMKYENVNFIEAVKIVASKIGYNLKLDYSINSDINSKDYEIMEFAKKCFINNINSQHGINAIKYLNERGISNDIIKDFNIGLSLKTKDQLTKLLLTKGYSVKEIDDQGLIIKDGLNVYDFFNNRIMIPIENSSGQVVGFTGRIYHNEDISKYLNTKETQIYKKSNLLFNYNRAKKFIREEKAILVVEGNMDAIKLYSSGIKNIIALMGVALSLEQIKMLKIFQVPIILMLDNDEAGLNATIKLGQLLIDNKCDVKVIRLSDAKDPDEYIQKKGLKALQDNIKKAKNYLDFKLLSLKKNRNLDDIEELNKYIKEVINSLNDADELTKDIVISKISKDYQIDKNILKQKLVVSNRKVKIKNEGPNKKRKSKYELAVNKIIYNMICNPKYINIYKKRLGFLKEKIERIIVAEITYYNNEHKEINVADFLSHVANDNDIMTRLNDIINDCNAQEVKEDEFINYINIILDIYHQDEIQKIKTAIKEEMDINKKISLIEKLTELKKGKGNNERN